MTEDLRQRIDSVHSGGHELCLRSFNKILPNAGNMGVFCQSEEEFSEWTTERVKLTKSSDNLNQKYFELIEPIIYGENDNIPETVYTHLYIRRYDPSELHIGDVDFVLSDDEFQDLKKRLLDGEIISGARLYDRQDLDMIELLQDDNSVLAYVSTKATTERARIKQSEETKL